MSCTACKEYQLASAKLSHTVLEYSSGKCTTCKWCINLSLHTCISAKVRYINTVHNSSKHTNLVCLLAVYRLTGTSPPEVSHRQSQYRFVPFIRNCLDLLRYCKNSCLVKSCFLRSARASCRLILIKSFISMFFIPLFLYSLILPYPATISFRCHQQ